jgi:hypothetical protein
MGHARYPRREKFWSSLKRQIEALWVPDLPLAIHCTVYKRITKHWTLDEPRHWIVFDREIIWDCPGPFMIPNPERGRAITYFEDIYWGPHGSSVIANLLRQYLDRPRDRLFKPFEMDRWELIDILRAADRRLGRETLLTWAKTLDAGHPAHKVLAARFGHEQGRVSGLCPAEATGSQISEGRT